MSPLAAAPSREQEATAGRTWKSTHAADRGPGLSHQIESVPRCLEIGVGTMSRGDPGVSWLHPSFSMGGGDSKPWFLNRSEPLLPHSEQGR